MTRLAVNIGNVDAVWLGETAGHHGWRLVVTLESGATQVVRFADETEATAAYDRLVNERLERATVVEVSS